MNQTRYRNQPDTTTYTLEGSDLVLARAAVTDGINTYDSNSEEDYLTGLEALLPRLGKPLGYHERIVLINALFNYEDPRAAGRDPYPNASLAGYSLIDRFSPDGYCPVCKQAWLVCA
jgi:hypothetical protein